MGDDHPDLIGPSAPPTVEDVIKPSGQFIGWAAKGAGSDVITVTSEQFSKVQ